jgi:hypothetical protein
MRSYVAFAAIALKPASKMPPIVEVAFAPSAPFALKLLVQVMDEPLPFGATEIVAL